MYRTWVVADTASCIRAIECENISLFRQWDSNAVGLSNDSFVHLFYPKRYVYTKTIRAQKLRSALGHVPELFRHENISNVH